MSRFFITQGLLSIILLSQCFSQSKDSIDYRFSIGISRAKFIHDTKIDTNSFGIQKDITQILVEYKLTNLFRARFSYSTFVNEESGYWILNATSYKSLMLYREMTNLGTNIYYLPFGQAVKFQPYISAGVLIIFSTNEVTYIDNSMPQFVNVTNKVKQTGFGYWFGGGAAYRFYDRFKVFLEFSSGPVHNHRALQYSIGLIFDFKL